MYFYIILSSISPQKSRSRPPSFAGGDSPVLRSRSSTCDSIQSSSSPIANCPSRQFTLPGYTQSAGTSPKQHTNVSQYLGSGNNLGVAGVGNSGNGGGGGSSPSSACSQNVRAARNSLNMQSELAHVTGARKSTSTANMNSLKKRTAPAPPPGTVVSGASSSIFYGTLPHPPRHSQNMDANDVRAINHKNQPMDAYGTLPHMRSVESSPRITASGAGGASGGGIAGNGSNSNLMPAMTTFGHKRSPSGESLNRNIHLAGAKLVLPPTGELPTLKHVDKSALMRPKIPPPGPPAGN